ncbi:hypothetical protein [Qipengyuania gelatinilytica]|uniref:Lipoprotein n=1 Tax=Qipengyuania gelatinilytica TaxID=2867231 RepID=A0ABX9A6C1_9SPHN|nr:hypothetical protein [Qipengyuania gelatinilytica]QZD95804.1 hypothetical protein K3136_03535 [Qipengyuania gelatinilytica]
MSFISRPVRAAALAAASSLALTGCLLSPGAFTSELQVMQNGSFTYSYDGEIQMLALSKLAQMADKPEEFEAECYDEEYNERECTLAEVNEQRAEWDAEASARAAKQREEAEDMKAFLGGVDPSNPEAAQELAAKLERQRGWEEVTYKGDGLFDVDFRISGQLTHDFVFPVIEKMQMGNMFVTVILRDGGQVRVDAPGFAAQGGGNPMQGMMAGMAGLAQMSEENEGEEPGKIVVPEGTFTIITDGRILANNTDEGPQANARGQALVWNISPRTEQAPTALIAFD